MQLTSKIVPHKVYLLYTINGALVMNQLQKKLISLNADIKVFLLYKNENFMHCWNSCVM